MKQTSAGPDLGGFGWEDSAPRTFNRRTLLGGILSGFTAAYAAGCSSGAGGGSTGASTTPSEISAASGTTATTAIYTPTEAFDANVHLLKRLTAAPTNEALADLRKLGASDWLKAQLAGNQPEPASVASLLGELDAAVAAVDREANAPEARQTTVAATAARGMVLAAWSPNQLREVMVDVWADHLHVTSTSQPEAFLIYDYDQLLRTHALGKFSDLLLASAKSPAMLVYLDQARSRADGANIPNENYARELLELHTLGVDSGYTETDVRNIAYVLSGWSAQRGGGFQFRKGIHNLGPAADQSILGFTPKGAGEQDGVDLLKHLAHHKDTARFVSWKIARRFIADDLTIDDAIVASAAQAYLAADTSIAAVIEHLVSAPDFERRPNSMMRRPLDHLAGMLRIAGAPPAKLTPQTLRVLAGVQRAQGQLAYGWPSPDGYPTVGAAWSNAGGLISRWNVTFALWQRGLAAIGVSPTHTKAATGIDVDAFASDLVSTYLADTASTALVSTIADVLNTAADPLNPDAETFAAAMTVITASPQFSLR